MKGQYNIGRSGPLTVWSAVLRLLILTDAPPPSQLVKDWSLITSKTKWTPADIKTTQKYNFKIFDLDVSETIKVNAKTLHDTPVHRSNFIAIGKLKEEKEKVSFVGTVSKVNTHIYKKNICTQHKQSYKMNDILIFSLREKTCLFFDFIKINRLK